MSLLPRVTAFPILPEGHMIYKVSGALSLPSKEKHSSPLIGKPAPEIILKDQLGRDCSLHATIALGRPIVLFFFPLAGSPHCTLESCYFRDALAESAVFSDLDAIIIGVSQDSPQTLKRFVTKHDLGYIILSDHEREAMQTFGVTRTWMGLINSRSTFIIDPNGIIRAQCEGVLAAAGHRQFAEKWLIRIEHELVGREKSVEDLDDSAIDADEDDDDEADAARRATAGNGINYRVVHGDVNSAKGAGIDKAPRYGAAPLPPMPYRKQPSANGLRNLMSKSRIASSSSTNTTSTKLSSPAARSTEDFRAESSEVTEDSRRPPRARSSSFKSSKKSLRRVFQRSREEMPPMPPTYQNFDEDIVQLGGEDHEVIRGPDSAISDGHSIVSSTSGSLSQNHSSSQAHTSSSHAHTSSSGSRASHGIHRSHTNDQPAVSLIPLRPGEPDIYTQSHLQPQTTPQAHPLRQPSRRKPVPRIDATLSERRQAATAEAMAAESSTTKDTVAQSTTTKEPSAQLLPREVSSSSTSRRPSTAPSQPSGVPSPRGIRNSSSAHPVNLGVLSPSSMASGQGRTRTTSKEASGLAVSRNTPRSHHQAWPSSSSSSSSTPRPSSRPSTGGARSSLETVRVEGRGFHHLGGSLHSGNNSTDSFRRDGRSTPLSPAPPALRQNRGGPTAAAMASTVSSSGSTEGRNSASTSRNTPTPPLRESLDSVADAQVQAVRRMVIHAQPASPQRVSSIRVKTSGSGSNSSSNSPNTSPPIGADAEGNRTTRRAPSSPTSPQLSPKMMPRRGSGPRTIPQQAPVPTYAPPPPPSASTRSVSMSPPRERHAVARAEVPRRRSSTKRYSVQSHGDYNTQDDHDDGASVMTTSTGAERRPSASSIASVESHGTFGR